VNQKRLTIEGQHAKSIDQSINQSINRVAEKSKIYSETMQVTPLRRTLSSSPCSVLVAVNKNIHVQAVISCSKNPLVLRVDGGSSSSSSSSV